MIIKIDGKYYEEIEEATERQQLKAEIAELNQNDIPGLKESVELAKARLAEAVAKRDSLKARLDQLI